MKVSLGLALTVCMLAAPVSAGDAKTLSGRELETLFSGATMRGDFVKDSGTWSERTTKSGRVIDILDGGKQVGAWYVAGDRVCYIYYGNPPSTPCYAMSWEGEVLVFADPKTDAPIARATRVTPSRR